MPLEENLVMQIFQFEFGTPEYDTAVRLRYEVLRRPLGLEYTPEQLAAEYSDIHLGAFDANGAITGCLILTPLAGHTIKMRQVAVDPAWQGRGVGTELVAASEQLSKRLGFTIMSLHAREIAVPFYLRLGYTIIGERFEEVGIPHFKMEKNLE